MRWTVRALAGGPRRVNHAAVAVGKVIYSFGGEMHYLSSKRNAHSAFSSRLKL